MQQDGGGTIATTKGLKRSRLSRAARGRRDRSGEDVGEGLSNILGARVAPGEGGGLPDSRKPDRVRADGRDNEAAPKYSGREQSHAGRQDVSFAQLVGYGAFTGPSF